MAVRVIRARWDPADHPRNPDNGRFIDKPGSGWVRELSDLMSRHRSGGRHRRDDTMPSSIRSDTIPTQAGPDLGIRADPDGVHVDYGTSQSGALDRKTSWALASLLRLEPAEDEPDRTTTNSVATYTSSDRPPSGFVQVTQTGDQFELELLNNDDTLRLTRPEASKLADAVENSGVARRVQLANGPADIWIDGRQIALRVSGPDGPEELRFTGADWGRISTASSIVGDGIDELGQLADPEVDIDRLRVQTNLGPVIVSRNGEVDAPGSTVRIAAEDRSWSIEPNPGDQEYSNAVIWVEELAENLDIHDFSDPSRPRGITLV